MALTDILRARGVVPQKSSAEVYGPLEAGAIGDYELASGYEQMARDYANRYEGGYYSGVGAGGWEPYADLLRQAGFTGGFRSVSGENEYESFDPDLAQWIARNTITSGGESEIQTRPDISKYYTEQGYDIGFRNLPGDRAEHRVFKNGRPTDVYQIGSTKDNFLEMAALVALGGPALGSALAGMAGVGGLGASTLPAMTAPINVTAAELASAGLPSFAEVAASGIGTLPGISSAGASMLPAMTAPISVAPAELAGAGFAGTTPAQVAASGIGSLPGISIDPSLAGLPQADYSLEGRAYGTGGLDPVTNAPINVGAGAAPSALSNLGSSFMNWAAKNPMQAIQLAGMLGGKLAGGGQGGGAGIGGVDQSALTAAQPAAFQREYVAPPAGFKPGISGEHVYFKKKGG